MSVYLGYQYFKRSNGKIILLDMNAQGSLSFLPPNYKTVICLREKDILIEKVKSLLHEFLHIGLEYDVDLYRKGRCPISIDTPPDIDDKIEILTEEIYREQPNFIRHLEKIILDLK